MSKKTNLLQEAKELNIPRRNCMQTKKQELEKATVALEIILLYVQNVWINLESRR